MIYDVNIKFDKKSVVKRKAEIVKRRRETSSVAFSFSALLLLEASRGTTRKRQTYYGKFRHFFRLSTSQARNRKAEFALACGNSINMDRIKMNLAMFNSLRFSPSPAIPKATSVCEANRSVFLNFFFVATACGGAQSRAGSSEKLSLLRVDTAFGAISSLASGFQLLSVLI